MSAFDQGRCEQSGVTCAYVTQALPASEAAAAEAHIAACPDCQREVDRLRPVIERFVAWPTDVLRPTTSLQTRLALRIAGESGKPPVLPPARRWVEPEWEEVAPGIQCKLLATDPQRHRVSMLVRLAPGASYPGHTHAGVEELHLLDGVLWIDERQLLPGDYNYAAPGTGDARVWSETGCTYLLITGGRDAALTMSNRPHISHVGLPRVARVRIQTKDDNHTVDLTSRIKNGRTADLARNDRAADGP